MADTIMASQITPAKYADFIAQLELVNLALRAARVVNLSFAQAFSPPETTLEISLPKPKSRYENKPGGFHIFQSYQVGIRDSASKRQIAKLSVEFALAYHSEKPMTDEIFSVFKGLNLMVNTWPYLREFIQTMAGRMNLPPLVLPTFKVGTPRRAAPKARREAGKAAKLDS